jgi:hypothetical protein
MHWITVLLVLSLAPSLSGWKLEESFSFTPVSSSQKWEMKSLPRSETISSGSPFSQYHSLKKISASPCAVREHWQVVGMIRTGPSLSVMVRMEWKPLSFGKGPMKSMATESQRWSGTGSGWRGPTGLVVRDLFRWQSAQAGTYACSRSCFIFGQ